MDQRPTGARAGSPSAIAVALAALVVSGMRPRMTLRK